MLNSKPIPSPVSLRDVAREAGVGRATAQRALSNSTRCAPATKERVLEAAGRLGYKPQPIFAAMGTRSRRKLMGDLPLAYIEADAPRHRVGGHYFDYAAARASALGYKLDRVDLDAWSPVSRLWEILYARGYAGVLVGGVRSDNHELLLANSRFPMVCCGRVDPLPFHTVRPSILNGVRVALNHIAAKGYRRIGSAVLRHDPPVEDDFSRFATALGWTHELPSAHAKIPPLVCGLDGGEALRKWVARHQPDAVLAFHDGILSEICKAGLRVPEDVGFASLHRGGVEPTAGLDQNFEAIATAAVNLMDQIIRHGEVGIPENPLTIMVESKWFDGATLPAVQHTKARASTAVAPGTRRSPC